MGRSSYAGESPAHDPIQVRCLDSGIYSASGAVAKRSPGLSASPTSVVRMRLITSSGSQNQARRVSVSLRLSGYATLFFTGPVDTLMFSVCLLTCWARNNPSV